VSFNKLLWFGVFSEGPLPAFPCPRCETGHLQSIEGTFATADAAYAEADYGSENAPEDYVRRSFVMLARCGNTRCGEVVSVAGEYSMEEVQTEFGYGLEETLNIKAIYPAPPMIDLPNETPRRVKRHLAKSFELYWMDYGACANQIRSAGEAILDELKVPKSKRLKAKLATGSRPAMPAKTIDLDFNGRIQWLEKRNKQNAKIIDALRKIGNLGSHGNVVPQTNIHTAMRLIDYLVSELFEKHIILRMADEVVKALKKTK
jgi:hypothetical protein